VRAWLTVVHGLADVAVPLFRPPCDTYKVIGAAAWAAVGAKAPKASMATAPSAVAAYRPARPGNSLRVHGDRPLLPVTDLVEGSPLTLPEAPAVGAASHLRRCATSVFVVSIARLPLWFAAPPGWRSSRPTCTGLELNGRGRTAPSSPAGVGRSAHPPPGARSHRGRERPALRWQGQPGRCRPAWRSGPVLPGAGRRSCPGSGPGAT
jgi:hypothetical protein